MTDTVTQIVIASAAVIGLVPLGVRSVHDMIRNRRRKKSAEQWTVVLVSVLASNLAPAVLTELGQRLGAVAEELPPWAKAAIGAIPPQAPPPAASAPPAGPSSNGQPAPEPSPDGSSARQS